MEKVDRVAITAAKDKGKLALSKKQRIKRFRGIIGKTSEETILWAIKEAEEL